MLSALATMGLETAWLPLLVALVGLPALYINLAMDAFKDYCELIKSIPAAAGPAAIAPADTPCPPHCDRILDAVRDELKIFDLDWWVVAALGVLLFAMICAANLPNATTIVESCSPDGQGNIIKAWMSLYATGFGLLMGFRLVWARLNIARGIRMYHEARLLP